MSRYIDADNLSEAVCKKVNNPAIRGLLNALINEQPTADVKEVKHGKWLKEDDTLVKCSVCGWYTDYDYNCVVNNGFGNADFLFCGHCGAQMDGGVKE